MPEAAERALRAEAEKKWPGDTDRQDRYVYGAMRNKLGWKPSTQKTVDIEPLTVTDLLRKDEDIFGPDDRKIAELVERNGGWFCIPYHNRIPIINEGPHPSKQAALMANGLQDLIDKARHPRLAAASSIRGGIDRDQSHGYHCATCGTPIGEGMAQCYNCRQKERLKVVTVAELLKSTGAMCIFTERKPGEWMYEIEENPPDLETDEDIDNYETGPLTAYGPFRSFEEARDHLHRNHANPGAYSVNRFEKGGKETWRSDSGYRYTSKSDGQGEHVMTQRGEQIGRIASEGDTFRAFSHPDKIMLGQHRSNDAARAAIANAHELRHKSVGAPRRQWTTRAEMDRAASQRQAQRQRRKETRTTVGFAEALHAKYGNRTKGMLMTVADVLKTRSAEAALAAGPVSTNRGYRGKRKLPWPYAGRQRPGDKAVTVGDLIKEVRTVGDLLKTTPEQLEEEEFGLEGGACPMCGGPPMPLGTLGNKTQVRCRNCGWGYFTDDDGDAVFGKNLSDGRFTSSGGKEYGLQTHREGQGRFEIPHDVTQMYDGGKHVGTAVEAKFLGFADQGGPGPSTSWMSIHHPGKGFDIGLSGDHESREEALQRIADEHEKIGKGDGVRVRMISGVPHYVTTGNSGKEITMPVTCNSCGATSAHAATNEPGYCANCWKGLVAANPGMLDKGETVTTIGELIKAGFGGGGGGGNFQEQAHPRAQGGQFTSKAGKNYGVQRGQADAGVVNNAGKAVYGNVAHMLADGQHIGTVKESPGDPSVSGALPRFQGVYNGSGNEPNQQQHVGHHATEDQAMQAVANAHEAANPDTSQGDFVSSTANRKYAVQRNGAEQGLFDESNGVQAGSATQGANGTWAATHNHPVDGPKPITARGGRTAVFPHRDAAFNAIAARHEAHYPDGAHGEFDPANPPPHILALAGKIAEQEFRRTGQSLNPHQMAYGFAGARIQAKTPQEEAEDSKRLASEAEAARAAGRSPAEIAAGRSGPAKPNQLKVPITVNDRTSSKLSALRTQLNAQRRDRTQRFKATGAFSDEDIDAMLEAGASALAGAALTKADDGDGKKPSLDTMREWMDDGQAQATDGCSVEPDGHCEHGKPSWLLRLGMI